MTNRQMVALLLATAPIVAAGQIAVAQPVNSTAPNASAPNTTAAERDAAPLAPGNATETTTSEPAGDATDNASNTTDDAPPQ